MCGIFGCSLKPGANRKAALNKLKILGLYNKSRGRDASGFFVNGDIIKGVGVESEFDDFIERKFLPIPKENGIVMGHTRQGSVGYKKTIDEAHPFLINEDLVFTHNGTIKNIDELCDKYRKDKDRFSVDSQALGTIIDEDGYNILDEYKGAAALAFTRLSQPNILFLYHGASKDYKAGPLLEERPLYYLECKDGVYYSSMEESLKAIREDEKELVHNLQYNHVYRVENGKFILDKTVPVERDEANVFVYTGPVYQGKLDKTSMMMRGGRSTTNRNSIEVSVKDLIRRESLPIKLVESKDRKEFVYYHWGRFWEAPRTPLNGPIYLKKGGWISGIADNASKLEFFWNGVMIKDKNSYEELKRYKAADGSNFVKDPGMFNYALHLSKYSKYPITNIQLEALNIPDEYRTQWYKAGSSLKNDNFTPAYSNGRNYKIESGYLTKITVSQREKPLWEDPELAVLELKMLIDGDLLSGTQGGSPLLLPFLSRSQSAKDSFEGNSDEQKGWNSEGDELVLWYDVPFLTREIGMRAIGDLEVEAMQDFINFIYLNEFGLTALPKEVEAQIEDMYERATKAKCSLLDTVSAIMDKQLFIDCYDKVIERETKREHMRKVFNVKEEMDMLNEKLNEEMTREEIVDNVETSINIMEDMQATAIDLIGAEDSELAQECANVLITSVLPMLIKYEKILDKYKELDLMNKVKKIREHKTMTDGVL